MFFLFDKESGCVCLFRIGFEAFSPAERTAVYFYGPDLNPYGDTTAGQRYCTGFFGADRDRLPLESDPWALRAGLYWIRESQGSYVFIIALAKRLMRICWSSYLGQCARV